MNKLTLTILTFILVLTFSITLASADVTQLLCLKKGETAEFSKCNPSISDYVCKRTSCQTCVIKKDAGHYCPASQNACNSLGLSCSLLNDTGGTTEVDGDAPNISLFSPIQGEVYPSRSVILNLDIDELATVHYLDNINGRGRWTRVCKDCNEYSRKRSFNEGLNDITIMAEDLTGNIVYEDLSFYIDSKSPKIKRTEPRKGFASGLFEVQFTEENPASLILQYGSFFTGMNEAPLNLEECSIGGTTTSCSAEVNLSSYSGQKIQYWFMLEDMAGSQVISKAVELKVDTQFPVINSINYTIDGRRAGLIINVTEENLDEITYLDNSDRRPAERRLCSKLKDGICEKKITLNTGAHSLKIAVLDGAGNLIVENLEIII